MSVDDLERELFRDLLRQAGRLFGWPLQLLGILFAGWVLFEGLVNPSSPTAHPAMYAAAGITGTAGLVLLVLGLRLARIEKRQNEQKKLLEEILRRLDERK